MAFVTALLLKMVTPPLDASLQQRGEEETGEEEGLEHYSGLSHSGVSCA